MTSESRSHADSIAPQTRMGAVHLTVSDLDRSLAFWTRAVGLRIQAREGAVARLGAGGEDLVVLGEVRGAAPVRGHTGLFHLALLVPGRDDLARWLVHAANDRVPLSGMSDHLVSEAIYLSDPDGHGIEIYADRPRSTWTRDGERIAIDTLPLDVDDLVATLDADPGSGFEGLPPGTSMGHVHLHVAEIAETEAFYAATLGFDITARYGAGATFLSAGGYHHHLGANVWAGRGASPPPPGSAALRHATIVLPGTEEVDRLAKRVADAGHAVEPRDGGVMVHDPSRNALLLVAEG